MIERVAVLPQTPLLVPELMGAAAGELAELRAECLRAAEWLTDGSADWTVLAAGARRRIPPAAAGTFRGYGVDVPVRLSPGAAGFDTELPLPALLAGWLRERAGAAAVTVHLIRTGDDVPAPAGSLLVLGDGSNRHGPKSPGHADARADSFDEAVAAALGAADPGALRALDPGLAAELGAGGLPVWRALAGLAGGPGWRGELRYSAAPYGVAYHVARWARR